MKDLELNWLSGIFLGWALASFAAGILALLVWSMVKQLQAQRKTVIEDAVNKVLK